MKFAFALVFLVAVASAAPAPQQPAVPDSPLSQLLQDAILEPATQNEALARNSRQTDFSNQNSPLSQLLYDILQIPQMALQAVSRLLTNPGNTIGQSFSFANTKPLQQQQTPNLI
ncbi:Hypothetical predicted protein [Cloeon dipterum]|uniref:Uncharacterized protein n=1 Tax=Cloeon dipterum TaxID=197152 RepID=A0A8S1D7G5_9INSE|nr:Hypothetical predicted protein [Cloeon dipterum]